ncbi:sodium-dependent multivitamin transporter-like isoform X2 [Branchiostoma floridae]|uniref:Sodium-dependent multivitamin transporter-like isoform X2 n=1 Tax=Branchiostoma floridae TaxID=7739 RepID=A0A9J7HNV2_BRAFL|nr:sodium-dependent multivitamin transporter-like isoform X2 [Branchiostoma floridae]
MEERRTFHVADYVVFSLMLVISAGIGVYYRCTGGKQKTTREFLMADRKMGVLPVALSLLASFTSAITLLGGPAESYTFGTQFWVIIFSYFFTFPVCGQVFLPIFYRLELTSAYEVVYMGIVLFAPALAIEAVTGLNVWISVVSMGVVCTFYTTLGGMKAVIWTDVFQCVIMFAGMITVLIKGSIEAGGIARVFRVAAESDRIDFFNFSPDPTIRHTVWCLVVGGAFNNMAIYATNQAQVQRYLAVGTEKQAKRAMWLNLPGVILSISIVQLCGLIIHARYHGCDPLKNGIVARSDQLLPYYVMEVLDIPGLPGLFISGIFSGALSTISSGINSLAAVTLEDLIKPTLKVLKKKDMTEERATLVSKILVVGFGGLCMLFAVLASTMGQVLQASNSVFGAIGGPLLGLFSLGMLFPWANSAGAIVGLLSGIFIAFWIAVGAKIFPPYSPTKSTSIADCILPNVTMANATTPTVPFATNVISTLMPTDEPRPAIAELYTLSYMWYSATAFAVVVVVGLLVSFITGPNKPQQVDPRLICPVFDRLLCCLPLPQSWRHSLHCGVRHSQQEHEHSEGESPETAASRLSEAATARGEQTSTGAPKPLRQQTRV